MDLRMGIGIVVVNSLLLGLNVAETVAHGRDKA